MFDPCMLKRIATISCVLVGLSLWLFQAPKAVHASIRIEGEWLGDTQGQQFGPVTEYRLSPEKLKKSYVSYLTRGPFSVVLDVYLFGVFYLILWRRWSVSCRDWIEESFETRFVQGLVLIPVACFLVWLLLAPIGYLEQCFAAWAGSGSFDPIGFSLGWMVMFLFAAPLSLVSLWILYWFIRRSQRRWWFYLWLIFIPINALEIYASPLIIEPLISRSLPLAERHADFASQLEDVALKGGLQIPPSRMYEMIALKKQGGPYGYATGLGSTRRIVIMDTSFRLLSNSQLLAVAAHELGHYALHHRIKQFLFSTLLSLLTIYLGYRLANWLLRRWGERWEIRGLDDWAAMPLLCFVFCFFWFVTMPISNTYSRYLEHEADRYALKIMAETAPNSGQIVAQAFQVLGEDGLDYPFPNKFVVFWTMDHPPTGDRVRFALLYNPAGAH